MRSIRKVGLAIALLCSGCVYTGIVENTPPSYGDSHDFKAPLARVLRDTRIAIRETPMTIIDEKQADGGTILMAEKGATAFGYNEIIKVGLTSPDKDTVRVNVVYYHDYVDIDNIILTTQHQFATDLFSRIQSKLDNIPDAPDPAPVPMYQ